MKVKRLRSVTHSMAHHAISGLSYLHPYLGEECKKLGIREIKVNLIHLGIKPELQSMSEELTLSIQTLRSRFFGLLASENVPLGKIDSATALFQFLENKWPSACMVEVNTKEGQVIRSAVGSDGYKAEILNIPS